jgi:PAS domain S-box-containing protein
VKILDADGTLLQINHAGLCMVEADSDSQVIGQNVYDIIAPEDRAAFRRLNERVCAGHKEWLEFDLIGLKGTRRRMETTAVPIANPLGGRRLHLAITRDITERKRAEADLRRAKDQMATTNEDLERRVQERTVLLRETMAQLEEFSYTVSHDLRTPLRAMLGYADLLAEKYGGRIEADGREYLNRLIQSGARMERLIRDILSYSQASRLNVRLQPVCLNALVADIVRQYPELDASRGDFSVSPTLPSVLGHEPSLGQAISNLLNNAVKFIHPGVKPNVEITADRTEGQVKLRIKDNGIGIKPDEQGRLFSMFERIPTQEKYEGNGIGLAIVRKAIERMGGQVGLESDGVHGSTFWILLPAAELPPAKTPC